MWNSSGSLSELPLKSGKWANELPRQITASKPSPGFGMSSGNVNQLASSITGKITSEQLPTTSKPDWLPRVGPEAASAVRPRVEIKKKKTQNNTAETLKVNGHSWASASANRGRRTRLLWLSEPHWLTGCSESLRSLCYCFSSRGRPCTFLDFHVWPWQKVPSLICSARIKDKSNNRHDHNRHLRLLRFGLVTLHGCVPAWR